MKKEAWLDPVLGPCACTQIRRTARALSTLYDEFLKPAGITVTQYAVLVNIARAGSIQRTQLAKTLGMDRTTLTRNLGPLERDGLLNEKTGVDRRALNLSLSAAGRKRLNRGYACWEKAQRAFLKDFGRERLEQMRELLSAAAAVSKAIQL